MIGQTKNIEYIDNLVNVPNFIVIVGSKGSGKTTLAKYIASKLNAEFAIVGIKVDEVREVIDTAYKARDSVVYCIQNADTMRNEAKNAMLKITEEPPENAYFIMTVEDDSSLLATIKSRAIVLYIEPYSRIELDTYCIEKGIPLDDIATTPYECELLNVYGPEFVEYVELVVDNIAEVEPANAFKSSSKLALKTDAGYDLKLFWKAFMHICANRILEDPIHYATGITVTSPYVCDVGRLGVNKQQLYDSWVFTLRSAWI